MPTDGTENSKGRTPEDSVRRPVRNMDDIARLFLSGARDQENTAAVPSPALQPATPKVTVEIATAADLSASDSRLKPAIRDAARRVVQLAMTAATGAAAWSSIAAAAQHLAAEWECSVGVVGIHDGVMRLLRAGETKCGATAIAGSAAGAPDLQLARALVGMQENIGHWIIALPAGRSADLVLAAIRDWLLVAATDNEGIVSAYRILKNVIAADPLDEPRAMRLFLACEDYASAAVAHARLARAAREFLHHELPLTGLSGRSPAPLGTIAEFKVGPDDGAVWASVAEFIRDLTGEEMEAEIEDEMESDSIDPSLAQPFTMPENPAPIAHAQGEIAEIIAAADEPSAPVPSPASPEPTPIAVADKQESLNSGKTEMVETPIKIPEPPAEVTAAAQEALGDSWNRRWDEPPTHPLPLVEAATTGATAAVESTIAAKSPASSSLLRAVEVGAVSDDVRWNVIAASAGELCLGDALEARPPGSERSAVWLDRAGKLHVWVLSEGSANWLAVWQWARQHRQLLALTRRDRWVDAAAEITMHVVLADGVRGKMAELPGVNWYRMALVRWGEKVGAVVVPA